MSARVSRRPCGRFACATPQLAQQVHRFIAARLLLYLGAMSSYFIGVMGTLTFSMGAGVGDNAIAVGLLNLCTVLGQIRAGASLRPWWNASALPRSGWRRPRRALAPRDDVAGWQLLKTA